MSLLLYHPEMLCTYTGVGIFGRTSSKLHVTIELQALAYVNLCEMPVEL